MDSPSTIGMYIPHLKKSYEHHRILPREKYIEARLHITKDTHRRQELHAQFNALDLERVVYIKSADKNINRLNRSSTLGLPLLLQLAAYSAIGNLERP